jgi:2-phosphoglycerate kinase
MIYLIGGPPRCGKTTLAKKLSQTLHIPWVSADTFESITQEILASIGYFEGDGGLERLDALLPKAKLRTLTGGSNDRMYNSYTAQEIADSYKQQARFSWTAIETAIKCEISEGHDYIIEGHQIHPQLVDKIVGCYGSDKIRVIFLIKLDLALTSEGLQKNDAFSDWAIQKTTDTATFPQIAAMINEYSRFFKEEAEKYSYNVTRVDEHFTEQIDAACAILISNKS